MTSELILVAFTFGAEASPVKIAVSREFEARRTKS